MVVVSESRATPSDQEKKVYIPSELYCYPLNSAVEIPSRVQTSLELWWRTLRTQTCAERRLLNLFRCVCPFCHWSVQYLLGISSSLSSLFTRTESNWRIKIVKCKRNWKNPHTFKYEERYSVNLVSTIDSIDSIDTIDYRFKKLEGNAKEPTHWSQSVNSRLRATRQMINLPHLSCFFWWHNALVIEIEIVEAWFGLREISYLVPEAFCFPNWRDCTLYDICVVSEISSFSCHGNSLFSHLPNVFIDPDREASFTL